MAASARRPPRSDTTAPSRDARGEETPPDRAPPHAGGAVGILLRFVSCGILSLAGGVLWRFTLAPQRIGIGSALLGLLFLLIGFIIGGVAWYLRDAGLRSRNSEAVSDERLVFSFVVFAAMPFVVLVVVLAVWLLAILIGAR